MKTFSAWLEDKKAYYSNKNKDAKNFPQVDNSYLQYSKSSEPSLKKITAKMKLNNSGSKPELLTKILQKLYGPDKVQGYYDKRTHDDFKHVHRKAKAKASATPKYRKGEAT
ncbi:MAG: hypothetical protein ACR2PH_04515 [Desulfobulbia bacterium]